MIPQAAAAAIVLAVAIPASAAATPYRVLITGNSVVEACEARARGDVGSLGSRRRLTGTATSRGLAAALFRTLGVRGEVSQAAERGAARAG
jgi:hypothetical protein